MHYRSVVLCLVVAACISIPTAGYASLEFNSLMTERASPPAADLTLTFNNDVDLARSSFELLDENRQAVPIDDLQLGRHGTDVILPINERLMPGRYTMKWRTFSKDGRASEGSYTFQIQP